MSHILNKTSQITRIHKNLRQINLGAFYSRRSDSSDSEPFYKVVKGKVRIEGLYYTYTKTINIKYIQ